MFVYLNVQTHNISSDITRGRTIPRPLWEGTLQKNHHNIFLSRGGGEAKTRKETKTYIRKKENGSCHRMFLCSSTKTNLQSSLSLEQTFFFEPIVMDKKEIVTKQKKKKKENTDLLIRRRNTEKKSNQTKKKRGQGQDILSPSPSASPPLFSDITAMVPPQLKQLYN